MTDDRSASAVEVDLDGAVARILRRCSGPADTVVIDGPSGAGKSTLADALIAQWPGAVTLVRMDNIYPGWGGLAAASEHVHEHLLEPRMTGGDSRWRRHDWESGSPAEWHPVPANRAMILEGCGALSRLSASLATVRIWLAADDVVRKQRALARDDGGFDAHWDDWQEQFVRFVTAENPEAVADIRLRLA
ncbi:uridine kinase [Mycetocola sp. CAN_C7]|uniref:ATP-binding protein n=1 Tax=Mycetocola sp. CAN_C7 TaxID=2787724 RepID=UPI001A330157